jgi:PAS domain S-box-containing protein
MMSTDEITTTESWASEDLTLLDAAIALLTADHVVTSWNPRAESMTGYSVEALNRLDLRQLLEPVEVMQQMLLRGHGSEVPVNEQLKLKTADGKHLPVDVQCAPLRSLDGSDVQLVLVIRPVAPLQELQLRAARARVLGRLAGPLSHEMRNPLNAIFLHTDIVEEEVRQPTPVDRTQAMRSLAIIKEEGSRLQALLQDYLFLARVSDLHRTPEALGALVEALVLDLQTQSIVRGAILTLSGSDDLGEVFLHSSLFRRALVNIMQQLIEALPRDGTLSVHGRRTTSHVHLSIHDTEKAVPAETWAALQTSLQATNPEGEVDFGVYVAREIITAHGGEVTVTEAPDTGMRCIVTLPLGITA